MKISYNTETFNLENPNKILNITINNDKYETLNLSVKKIIITLHYENIIIISNNILEIYVILQYIYGVKTLVNLSKIKWDYSKWKIKIVSKKKLPDWANILNCLLNLGEKFNTIIKIEYLEQMIKLNDKRGWGGERPREVYYKLGFPLYTSKTKKSLKNGERLFECPFPICSINPKRKSIIQNNPKEKKCFTCGTEEGNLNYFGNMCTFEKGHFNPHIHGGDEKSGYQCKWCNSFYKDKINWNFSTGKPVFKSYAILRDAPKKFIIQNLKKLGFTPKDLE